MITLIHRADAQGDDPLAVAMLAGMRRGFKETKSTMPPAGVALFDKLDAIVRADTGNDSFQCAVVLGFLAGALCGTAPPDDMENRTTLAEAAVMLGAQLVHSCIKNAMLKDAARASAEEAP